MRERACSEPFLTLGCRIAGGPLVAHALGVLFGTLVDSQRGAPSIEASLNVSAALDDCVGQAHTRHVMRKWALFSAALLASLAASGAASAAPEKQSRVQRAFFTVSLEGTLTVLHRYPAREANRCMWPENTNPIVTTFQSGGGHIVLRRRVSGRVSYRDAVLHYVMGVVTFLGAYPIPGTCQGPPIHGDGAQGPIQPRRLQLVSPAPGQLALHEPDQTLFHRLRLEECGEPIELGTIVSSIDERRLYNSRSKTVVARAAHSRHGFARGVPCEERLAWTLTLRRQKP
jgi:hypothetical protein